MGWFNSKNNDQIISIDEKITHLNCLFVRYGQELSNAQESIERIDHIVETNFEKYNESINNFNERLQSLELDPVILDKQFNRSVKVTPSQIKELKKRAQKPIEVNKIGSSSKKIPLSKRVLEFIKHTDSGQSIKQIFLTVGGNEEAIKKTVYYLLKMKKIKHGKVKGTYRINK